MTTGRQGWGRRVLLRQVQSSKYEVRAVGRMCTHARMHTRMHTHIRTHAHTHQCTYIHTYIHTHSQTYWMSLTDLTKEVHTLLVNGHLAGLALVSLQEGRGGDGRGGEGTGGEGTEGGGRKRDGRRRKGRRGGGLIITYIPLYEQEQDLVLVSLPTCRPRPHILSSQMAQYALANRLGTKAWPLTRLIFFHRLAPRRW